MVIKAQVLADFIVEFTYDVALKPKKTLLKAKTPKKQVQENDLARWKLFMDGLSNHP